MNEVDQALNFYLALLSVQMAILGLVVAGLVTLMQMLHRARPRRMMRLLVSPWVTYGYVAALATTLIVLCVAVWSVAFGVTGYMDFFMKRAVGASLLGLCLLGLFWFVFLVYRTRRLLEAEEYLKKYIGSVKYDLVREYLFRWYATRPDEQDGSEPVKISPEALQAWQDRFDRATQIPDQFQPVREYLKDNSFNSYDTGTATGLRFFSQMFDSAFEAIGKNPGDDEYYYLAKYFSDSCEEFFSLFLKTSSEKRQTDTIQLVAEKGHKFVGVKDCEGLATIIRCLEALAKKSDDEDEVILCIESIRALTDAYLLKNKQAKWDDISTIFEESCLAVTRLAETYYLQKDNPLRTIPVISHYTGEHRTVTTSLVNFFDSYDDLGDRYPDVYPVRYFEAIEAVIEVIFARYGEIMEAGQETRGLNVAYQLLSARLYGMYRTFGLDAIEHHKPALLALCLGNLRRIIKPAKNFGLNFERAELTRIILELSLKGIAGDGDTIVKDTRTISAYVHVTLDKHASKALINDALKELAKNQEINLQDQKLQPFLKLVSTIK